MQKASESLRLYRHPLSGHCQRVERLLAILGLPHTLIEVDLARAEQKEPAFIAKSPFGQIPVLEDGDVVLADSNAILVYLATRYDPSGAWLPQDAVAKARVQQWLSVAAGPLAYGPAAARRAVVFGAKLDHEDAKIASHSLLTVIERHLEKNEFLVGTRPTIADLAVYAYVAWAPQGGVELDGYPHTRRWLSRVADLPERAP